MAHYKLGSGVKVVDVDELGDPNVLSDGCTTQPMEPRPQTASSGGEEGDLVDQPGEDIGHHLNRHAGPMDRLTDVGARHSPEGFRV